MAPAEELEVQADAAPSSGSMSVLDALKGTISPYDLCILSTPYHFSLCLKNFRTDPTPHDPGVLKLALTHDGLARGLREASKALDRRQAHMCVLNEACEEEAYKKLVVALCSEHKIPLIKVPDGKMLGEWAGLCVLDREGNARKVVNCSCVVVRDWGEESQERNVLLNYFQTEQ